MLERVRLQVMHKAYIALGSNLNMPQQQLQEAIKSLQNMATTEVVAISPFYQSIPLGPQDQPDYINAVACINTKLKPLELLQQLQNIEQQQGRQRLRHWGERTLDLDILLYDNLEMQTEKLTIPHYDMHNREFVIVPLADIAPELILPNGIKINELVKTFLPHQMQKIL